MANPATAERPGSLLLLSFARRPSVRIINYLLFMTEQGVSIDFVLWDTERWLEYGMPSGVRAHQIRLGERRLFNQRLKRLFLYRVPGFPLWLLWRVADSNPITRPVAPVMAKAQRFQRRAGKVVERRLFDPVYRILRPFSLARVADKAIRASVDLDGVTRIVSAEATAVTCAWRLAKRLPGVTATVSLDRAPMPPVTA